MYNPENQYRCTIIRGKSQSDMEDLLPLYANTIDKYCPCEESIFKASARNAISKAIFSSVSYDSLSDSNKKTVDNHLTEIAGTLLGLYYPEIEEDGRTYIYESDACKYLVENNDFPTFFKNLCLNFQFPNGAKWIQYVQDDMSNSLNIRPFCYVIHLLYIAQEHKQKLAKQEIGYYVLNSLDVLQGKVSCEEVFRYIMDDRKNGVKRDKLSGSHDWQHIKEQINLLELTNMVESDSTYLWLNNAEATAISIFIQNDNSIPLNCYDYPLNTNENKKKFFCDWKRFYGRFNEELRNIKTKFDTTIHIEDKDSLKHQSTSIKSTIDLGDEGEALVYRLEQERVRKYKERLVNKVLLLGKTKGLGYDISSIEADENPQKPEFARYIEVKSTKRTTEPSFDNGWNDSVNLTAKEWIAAEQYGKYYNIYRVYFTKKKTIIVRINDPFGKNDKGEIEVYPTIYQMNFCSNVIEIRYNE